MLTASLLTMGVTILVALAANLALQLAEARFGDPRSVEGLLLRRRAHAPKSGVLPRGD